MAYTPLTTEPITMQRLNRIFAELDGSISGGALTGTAGETLSERDFVYLASDGSWYQLDTDETSDIASGSVRGIVTESGGITSAATGEIKINGIVGGYTGLSAWGTVYASTTAGGYTQTRPNVTLGGGQVAIIEMGFAISTTEILLNQKPIVYAKRASLADDGTLTIEHHSDAPTRTRQTLAYVATDVAGTIHAEYADSNQDSDIALRQSGLAGDSITITASGGVSSIGDSSGSEVRLGQQFLTTNGGELTAFSFTLTTNTGSPTGDITWQIMTDNSDEPGTQLATGTKTPTPSSSNTVSGLSGLVLDPATKYWLVLSTVAQPNNTAYQWQRSTSSVYADGIFVFSLNGGSSWTPFGADCACSFTISATGELDELAQSFEVTGSQEVATVKLWLKKVGSPTGTMTLRIETDNTGEPSGTLADANLTVDVAESSLGTSYADITFTFSTPASISGSTTYWIVLSTDRSASASNYVLWGVDTSTPSYADGEFMSEASSSWSSESADGVFSVEGDGTAYDEPLSIGSDTGAIAEMGVRFDDGAGSDDDTMTTFQNLTGATADIVCEVVLQ